MYCTECKSKKTIVLNSRHGKGRSIPKIFWDMNVRWRKRKCLKCNYQFNSLEIAVANDNYFDAEMFKKKIAEALLYCESTKKKLNRIIELMGGE